MGGADSGLIVTFPPLHVRQHHRWSLPSSAGLWAFDLVWKPLSAPQAAASTSPTTALSNTTSAESVPCPHTCGHAGLSVPNASIPRAISESRLPSSLCGRQLTKLSSRAVAWHCTCRSHFRSIENSLTMNLRVGEVSPGGTTSGLGWVS